MRAMIMGRKRRYFFPYGSERVHKNAPSAIREKYGGAPKCELEIEKMKNIPEPRIHDRRTGWNLAFDCIGAHFEIGLTVTNCNVFNRKSK